MLSERGSISNDLPCYLCGKSTPTRQLKITGEGNWICSFCAQRVFKRHVKRPIEVKEEKKEIPRVHFELDEQERVSFPSLKKIDSTPSLHQRRHALRTSSFGDKELYKCTHCRFESRHYRDDEMCPNCGKDNRLVKVPHASDLVDELRKHPL